MARYRATNRAVEKHCFRQHPEPHFSLKLNRVFFDYVPIKVFLIPEPEKVFLIPEPEKLTT